MMRRLCGVTSCLHLDSQTRSLIALILWKPRLPRRRHQKHVICHQLLLYDSFLPFGGAMQLLYGGRRTQAWRVARLLTLPLGLFAPRYQAILVRLRSILLFLQLWGLEQSNYKMNRPRPPDQPCNQAMKLHLTLTLGLLYSHGVSSISWRTT